MAIETLKESLCVNQIIGKAKENIVALVRIDLYMKAPDDAGKMMYGMLISSFEVLAVRDGSGKNVFDQNPPGSPSELLFAVPNDMYTLLSLADALSQVQLVPVPRNKTYTAEAGETQYESETLRNYILSKTVTITDYTVESADDTEVNENVEVEEE